MKNSTWSGRFKKGLDEEVLEFSESISFDHLLFDSDIRVCIAHAEMLSECKIISEFFIAFIFLLCINEIALLNETTERGWNVEFKINVL